MTASAGPTRWRVPGLHWWPWILAAFLWTGLLTLEELAGPAEWPVARPHVAETPMAARLGARTAVQTLGLADAVCLVTRSGRSRDYGPAGWYETYICGRTPSLALDLFWPDRQRRERLTGSGPDYPLFPALEPGGTRLAYFMRPPGSPLAELRVQDAARRAMPVVRRGWIFPRCLMWAPGGGRLALIAYRQPPDVPALWMADAPSYVATETAPDAALVPWRTPSVLAIVDPHREPDVQVADDAYVYRDLAWAHDGRTLYAVAERRDHPSDRELRIIDADAGQVVDTLAFEPPVAGLAAHPTQPLLALALRSRDDEATQELCIWNAETHQEVARFSTIPGRPVWTADGARVHVWRFWFGEPIDIRYPKPFRLRCDSYEASGGTGTPLYDGLAWCAPAVRRDGTLVFLDEWERLVEIGSSDAGPVHRAVAAPESVFAVGA